MVEDRTDAATDRRWALGATIIAVSLLACLLLRAFQLQVLQGSTHKQHALDRALSRVHVTPVRGRILDRTGVPLAEPRESYEVYVSTHFAKHHDASIWKRVQDHLDLRKKQMDQVRAFVDGRTAGQPRLIRIARGLTREQADALRGDPTLRWRLNVRAVESRRYPFGHPFAHVVGTLGEVDKDELAHHPERGYRAGERNGRSGIEAAYETKLRGRPGFEWKPTNPRVRVATDGRVATEALPGEDVRTTLDANLQQRIHEAFDQAHESFGAAVMVDVSTGGVRALYARPAIDPNVFERSVTSEQAEALFSDPKRPFLNRAIAASYAAGTVIEPFLLANAGRPEATTSAFERFGFGHPTGIGLTPEARGSLSDTPSESTVTPLQLARAYAALANGGMLHPVGLVPADTPSKSRFVGLARDLLARVAGTLPARRPTSDSGFADPSKDEPSVRVLSAMGEPRSSATGEASTDCAWVVGFAPTAEPRIAFAIVVEQATTPASARSIAARVLAAGAGQAWWTDAKGNAQ